MKRKFNYIAALFILFASCSDSFFDTAPATQVTTPEVFSSERNIDAFVNGAIRLLMDNSTSQDNLGLPTMFHTHDVNDENAFAGYGRSGDLLSFSYNNQSDISTIRG